MEKKKQNIVSWQGWRLVMPAKWDPTRLDGDYDQGQALFADMLRPRLGIRWEKAKDGRKWVEKAIRDEVGTLAAKEVRPVALGDERWMASQVYIEPEVPGRDVWAAYSAVSQRGIVLTYHAHHRDRVLEEHLVHSISDLPVDQPMPWSIFDLNCVVPAGWMLEKHRLNAGDLSLAFYQGNDEIVIRQIAMASVALQRQPLGKWLDDQMQIHTRHYRPNGGAHDFELLAADRTLKGKSARLLRRKRFFWKRSVLPVLNVLSVLDEPRDRLLVAQGGDRAQLEEFVKSVGGAV